MFCKESLIVHDKSDNAQLLNYVPEYWLEDGINKEALLLPAVSRISKLGDREALGYYDGLLDYHKAPSKDTPGIEKTDLRYTWYSTDEVLDVRLFFRKTKKFDEEKTIGSKARIYHMGKKWVPENKRKNNDNAGNLVPQHLDTDFIKCNIFNQAPNMIFKQALARTVLHNALYAMGSDASIRKINTQETDEVASYRYISLLKPVYIDFNKYNNIMEPSLKIAGIENTSLENSELNKLMEILMYSKDMDDFGKRMIEGLPALELNQDDINHIIEESNSDRANISNEDRDIFESSPGVSVLETLKILNDIADTL